LIVYRFGTSLYYANASRLSQDIAALTGQGPPTRWIVLDAAAIGDVDYTAGYVLSQVIHQLTDRNVRVCFTSILDPVREQLARYGITEGLDPNPYFDTPGEALEAFHAAGT
jgi:MFS superfamily sulfate permease-like transporter